MLFQQEVVQFLIDDQIPLKVGIVPHGLGKIGKALVICILGQRDVFLLDI